MSSSGARVIAGLHEQRVIRRLEGRGLPGLGESLVDVRGAIVGGRWRIESLYAVGAEGAVYVASDGSAPSAPPCVVKIPLVHYHRPAELSSSAVRVRREALRTEGANLARSASPYMPSSLGIHDFVNPLHDTNRGGAFAEKDPALVMERLPGFDVDLWLARVHTSDLPRPVLRHHLDRLVVVLLQALNDLYERGYYYADLRPGNLRVLGRPERRVRLLDAGSLVEVTDESGRFPHVPHYLPVELFEARYTKGESILPTPAVQAVMAGRTLYEVATGGVPVPGRPLEAIPAATAGVSAPVADVVDGLASGSFSSVVPALKYLARRAARRGPAPASVPRPALELGAPAAAAPPPAARPVASATRSARVPRTPPRGFFRRLFGGLFGRS